MQNKDKVDILGVRLRETINGIIEAYLNGDTTLFNELLDNYLAEAYALWQNAKGSLAQPTTIKAGDLPKVEIFNNFFKYTQQDLKNLFSLLKNARTFVLDNFNMTQAEIEEIKANMKKVNSKILTYKLYADLKDDNIFYFTDSFDNKDMIDMNPDSYEDDMANVFNEAGIVTLPIADGSPKTWQEALRQNQIPYNITYDGDGQPGSNFESTRGVNTSIDTIKDGDPGTWFEYEKVSAEKIDSVALKLKLVLNTTSIINYIFINPFNFGVPCPVTIERIETSKDGGVYESIEEDQFFGTVPIELSLSPVTSKGSGEAHIFFSPRRAKFVNITLKQSFSYPILNGKQTLHRYAIGIRDIVLAAFKYKEKGSIITKDLEIPTGKEVDRVLVDVKAFPIQGTLLDHKYYISPDKGTSWTEVSAEEEDNYEVPEVLFFNNSEAGAVQTDDPVNTVRLKVGFERKSGALALSPSSSAIKKRKTEIVSMPNRGDGSLSLANTPTLNSITVVNPMWGAIGKEDFTFILGVGNGAEQIFDLPISLEQAKLSDITVYVDKKLWSRVSDLTAEASTVKQVYDITNKSKVRFAYIDSNGTQHGKAVQSGAKITITYAKENLTITSSKPLEGTLNFTSDGVKGNIEIERISPLTKKAVIVGTNKTSQFIGYKNIMDTSGYERPILVTITDGASTTYTRKDYKDGESELSGNNQFSIDTENGILYTRGSAEGEGISSSVDSATLTFAYLPITTLDEDDFEVLEDLKTIRFDTNAFKSLDKITTTMTAGLKGFKLDRSSTPVPGSFKFFDATGKKINMAEVPFVDGISELSSTISYGDYNMSNATEVRELSDASTSTWKLSLENFSHTDLSLESGMVSFYVLNSDGTHSEVPVANPSLSNDNFSGSTLQLNKWQFSFIGGIPTVRIVTYDVDVPQVDGFINKYIVPNNIYASIFADALPTDNRFSVDYDNKIIHFSTKLAVNTTMEYSSIYFRVAYNVSKEITNFFVKDDKIYFDPKDMLSTYVNSEKQSYDKLNLLRIDYDYKEDLSEEVKELMEYLTPLLYDYTVKVGVK